MGKPPCQAERQHYAQLRDQLDNDDKHDHTDYDIDDIAHSNSSRFTFTSVSKCFDSASFVLAPRVCLTASLRQFPACSFKLS